MRPLETANPCTEKVESFLCIIIIIYLFKRDNAHPLTFFVYTQNVSAPELAEKLIFICSPLAGQHIIILH